MFIDKVQAVENKFIDLEQRISDPSVIARQEEWQKLTKEHAALSPLIEVFRKYKDVTAAIRDDKEIVDDGSGRGAYGHGQGRTGGTGQGTGGS